jgi:hypothetical protein
MSDDLSLMEILREMLESQLLGDLDNPMSTHIQQPAPASFCVPGSLSYLQNLSTRR